MIVIRDIKELKETLAELRKKGSIGFVPTMGALHAGHISLIERSVLENATTIASVFVNPTQFNDVKDLENYPRTEEADFAILKAANCNVVFAPSVKEIYPEDDTRTFDFGDIERVMEGASRPGHFNGVAQVVSRLFECVKPDNAYFGAKDFQQVSIIKQMCKILNLSLNIVVCPTIRDIDGLALSSRNALLTTEEREIAPAIYMTLKESLNCSKWGTIQEVKNWVIEQLESNEKMKCDYFEIVDSLTLQSVSKWDESSDIQGCIAVKLGKIRLIDNINFRKL